MIKQTPRSRPKDKELIEYLRRSRKELRGIADTLESTEAEIIESLSLESKGGEEDKRSKLDKWYQESDTSEKSFERFRKLLKGLPRHLRRLAIKKGVYKIVTP